jgi:hypothetical protein
MDSIRYCILCIIARSLLCIRRLESKLQETTALSMAEAEYYWASTTASIEVLYLRNLFERMGFAQPQQTLVYEDNTGISESAGAWSGYDAWISAS